MTGDDWQQQARCRGMNPDIFHPTHEDSCDGATEHAKTICAQCPVTTECLNYALANHEKVGVWGGTSGRERRQMWRKQANQRRQQPRNTPTVGTRQPKPLPAARPEQCGTLTGYRNHTMRHETPCDPCRTANAEYLRWWRQQDRTTTRLRRPR